jgi:sialate O-acetylesterase
MTILTGLFDHMVLQRNRANCSEALITGRATADGPVLATVGTSGKTRKGFARKRIGRAVRGRFTVTLKGLPVGGPYDIELRVGGEAVQVRDVLVGDVWLLGGQSNMQGCGFFPKKRLPAVDSVRAFFMDDRWDTAVDPIHNMWACVDQVHIDLCGGVRPGKAAPDWGVCAGPAFGQEMFKQTQVPQGLIACAHGGTSMTQWDTKLRKLGSRSLYGALLRRLAKNGGRVAGLLWYQGCSDANPEAAPLYTDRMKRFCTAIRRDCRDGKLPIAVVQIGRVIASASKQWNSIQEQERRLPEVIGNLQTVPVVDLALDDSIHISGESQTILGHRLVNAMQVLRKTRQAGPPVIALKKVSVEELHGRAVVVAEFDNVVGKLCAGSRPSGFAIVLANGSDNLFDIRLEGNRARLLTVHPVDALSGAKLHYGYGTNPYCNITDEANRSLPVFGPVDIGSPRAITPFVQTLRVSDFQPTVTPFGKLGCPASLNKLGLKARTFSANFCDLHPVIQARGRADEVVFYACRFACPTAMRLAVLLGYDGPVKAWVDGKPIVCDPAGVNPATPSKQVVPLKAAAGEHEIVVALGTNSGAAWGIFLRLERLDITKRQFAKGPGAYVMPEIKG